MPMGIVSEKEFENEVQNSNKPTIPIRPIIDEMTPIPTDLYDNLKDRSTNHPMLPVVVGEVQTIKRGRGKDNIEVPNVLRNIIGETHTSDGREAALQIAEAFSISSSSVSAYAEGATSTASYNDRPNKKVIDSARVKIADKAKSLTLRAMENITEDKLESASAGELSVVAKNAASIVKTMEDEIGGKDNPLNISPIVIYAPQVKNENNYEVVYAKE